MPFPKTKKKVESKPEKKLVFAGTFITCESKRLPNLTGIGAGKSGGGMIIFPAIIVT